MKSFTFSAQDSKRLQSLRQLVDRTRTIRLREDQEFQSMIRDGQRLLELSDQEMADAISVSRPTVNRWMNGKNLPHPMIRKPIVSWINKQLSRKIKVLEAAARHAKATKYPPIAAACAAVG